MLNSKWRRIGLFGGPGSGKSTLMAWLFSELKSRQIEIEMVPEWIKHWTYENKIPKGYDQIYVYGNVIQQEELALRSGKTEIVIADAPLLINIYYGIWFGAPGMKYLTAITRLFEKDYPSLNIFLKRANFEFSDIARFHSEEQSKHIDAEMLNFLREKYDSGDITHLKFFEPKEKENILNHILIKLKGD